ncbi:hypothetical protein BD779DRAFT_1679331 [Infundibulicybe gibba]|nr:hypothetical protein BD779DRAFT_1679331 [Infundibulicybe gibba]
MPSSSIIDRAVMHSPGSALVIHPLTLPLIHYMTTLRRVIVDDTDPRIQYSSIGQWTLSGDLQAIPTNPPNSTIFNGPPFQNTTHFTNTTSSLSLQFRGSQPQVFGTGANYECFVDDTSIGSELDDASIISNNVLLCDGTPLFEAKEYTLTLNVTHGGGDGFYFDYITYIPSTSDPLGSATVLVDKFDSAVVYNFADWSPGSFQNQVGESLDQADGVNPGIFTRTNGAKLTFNFTGASIHYIPADVLIYLVVGTSVSLVGFILKQIASTQSTSNAIYSVDKAKPVPFSFHASTAANISNQLLFTSPTLNPGPHSLEVIHQGNATTPPLVPDHFVVTNNVSTPPLQVPPAASASASSPPSAAPSANKPNTSVPIGAIVGGIIGGIAVFCLAAFLLRRRTRHKRFGTDHDNTATPHFMPFNTTSSGPTAAKAGNRTLKAHQSPMVDPPELPSILLNIPSIIDAADAAPRAETFSQRDPPLRAPPVERVHEDHSARSVTDGVADPPPSYVSR